MHIAVINQSSLVSNDQVNIMCQAIQIQLDLHFLPAWNLKHITIKPYTDAAKMPGYAWVVNILDHATQADALGYHSIDNDTVDAFIFAEPVLSNHGVVLFDAAKPQNVSVSSVLSHEVLEMAGDRFANQWADGTTIKIKNQQYSEYAFEMCDPVEADSYEINVNGTKVSLSNFIFPSWFNLQATTQLNMPFDYLHKLSAPFTMNTGGYIIVRETGNITQVFGDEVEQWKKKHVVSEWYRR